MNGFVAVHCGAGYHSECLNKEYKKLNGQSCRKAIDVLASGGDALEAVEAAIVELENSGLTNAGYGSNLSWEGTVECDASVMHGKTLHFGACGAVANIWNPISLAKQVCLKQSANLSLGRVPPCILTGTGAQNWANMMGIEIIDGKKMVSPKAIRTYKHCKHKLKRYCTVHNTTFSPLDTVGAVCVDGNGLVAAGASSGGVWMKHEGRVGQAAVFGSGVWAVTSQDGVQPSVASCTSGCGEHLIRTQLARYTAESVVGEAPALALQQCIKDKFLESPFLWDISKKLAGMLVLKYDPRSGDGDLLWAHSTKTMCLGFMAANSERPKCVISYLPSNMKVGKKAVVSGHRFKFGPQPSPAVERAGPSGHQTTSPSTNKAGPSTEPNDTLSEGMSDYED